MANTTVTFSIDADIMDKFKQDYPSGQRSKMISDFIQSLSGTSDKEQIDYALLKVRLSQCDQTLATFNAERAKLTAQIIQIDQSRESEKVARLEQEKADMEKMKSCQNCGHEVLDKNPKKFKIGIICQACYRGMTAQDLQKWSA